MNKSLQIVYEYHETTKHAQHRYARSLGYMDWSTQPDPFRIYKGAQIIKLPLALNHTTPPYHLLDEELPSAPLVKESLSQLLQFSMGIAAYKESGGSSWAVRCNASSGNLHPTESYVILPPVLKEQNENSTIYHYAPKNHTLEILAEVETNFWEKLPENSFIIGLSSISWREVWKYGERAFRYTQLDAGHAWQAFVVSAKMLGWKITRLDSVSDSDMSTLLGLQQKDRFFESENPDMLFVVSSTEIEPSLSIDTLVESVPLAFEGIANKLSPTMQKWDIIPAIEDATSSSEIAQHKLHVENFKKTPTKESKDVVLNRRSVHVMQKDISKITKEQFHTILQSVVLSQDGKENSAHLALFVNRVENYESGLYILVRDERDKESLVKQMDEKFKWVETELKNLYMLQSGDFTTTSKAISCNQDIAADGAFSLGMLCNFSDQLNNHGAHRYKELYWECGAIGQQLYLEATSLGLSGTGIGCFLDDVMHDLVGLKDNRFQILYHFTVGRGYVDSRITTKPAYD
ncbi:nitroreductase family protein [Candidatus Sulfurimonas marisnigri]|uniref:Nitroreductase family protein n=1 Tax=Candidatus Sulfurimonas marisnigri TaxID=2740405 RepID=A0A7S7M2B5_9BACT|nr:nitroreductase family protein [Candidatus Sulfurimonas marisnigri]QOY54934.1 nitroreductase family protein [Candidatus Sulfurimonas marisnigri]